MHPLRFCQSVCAGGALLLLLLNLPAIAQEPKALTLEESIEVAKQRNLTLQTAEENLKAAEAQVRAALGGLLPRVTANGNYTYFKDIQRSVIQAEGGFGFPMPGGGMNEMPPPSTDNESDLIELEFGAHHNCPRCCQSNTTDLCLGTTLLWLSSSETQLRSDAA